MSAVSLIPAAVDQSQVWPEELAEVPVGVLAVLSSVTDPRARRGVRHRSVAVLGIAVCAVLAGAKSYLAIAEWAQDLTPAVRAELGIGRAAPCESTIGRVLQRVDAEQLDRAVCAWLHARAATGSTSRRVIAVDGKSARGSRLRSQSDDRAVHLLAAFDTGTGAVLGQSVVEGKTNEISAFGPLLDSIELTGAIVTVDALHTQRGHVTYLGGPGAHWLLTVKGNQLTLLRQLRALPWADVPVADHTSDKGHGRIQTRTVKVTAVAAGLGFPHPRLALQVQRRSRRAGGPAAGAPRRSTQSPT